MCGRTGMSWRRRSTPGSRTGSRGGDDRVCLRRGEGLRSFQGGRETWKTASWQPAGSRIRLPLKESDIPVAVNPKSADGPSNNPQCGFWDSQFSAAQVKSVEQPCPPPQPYSAILDSFRRHLSEVKGLAPITIEQHCLTTCEFLRHCADPNNRFRLSELSQSHIEGFILSVSHRFGRSGLQKVVANTRSFLRFLAMQGKAPAGLSAQIDTPRVYRLEHLPRALPWNTVWAFLQSIDRSSAYGMRDYAIFL